MAIAISSLPVRPWLGEWFAFFLRLPIASVNPGNALELYLVALTAAAFLPENLRIDQFAGWIGLIVSRLTSITAIFGLCILALVPLRKWQVIGFVACAAVFFVFSYQSTTAISRVESN